MFNNQWLIVGISGVSNGGKTTLATALYNYFTNNKNRPIFNSNIIVEDATLICQDDYFLPVNDPRHKWIKKLNHINWEILTALDMDKMINDIRNLLSDNFLLYNKNQQEFQQTITLEENPDNHNSTTINSNGTVTTSTSTTFQFGEARKIKILIIEGFLIFNHPQLIQLCQIKFHIHVPYEKCFERRRQRSYDPPDVTGYFEMCVWPMYEVHYAEFQNRDDIYVLNGVTPKEKVFKYVLSCISNFLVN